MPDQCLLRMKSLFVLDGDRTLESNVRKCTPAVAGSWTVPVRLIIPPVDLVALNHARGSPQKLREAQNVSKPVK